MDVSHDISGIDFDKQRQSFTTIDESNTKSNEKQRQSFKVVINGPQPITPAEHIRLITNNSFDVLEMKLSSSSSNRSLTNVEGSKDDEFDFTEPKQLFEEETDVDETKAIKDHYQSLDDSVSHDILQQDKQYSDKQENALNNVINEHNQELAQQTTDEEDIWNEKEYLLEELWHQRLGHQTAGQLTTITKMAA